MFRLNSISTKQPTKYMLYVTPTECFVRSNYSATIYRIALSEALSFVSNNTERALQTATGTIKLNESADLVFTDNSAVLNIYRLVQGSRSAIEDSLVFPERIYERSIAYNLIAEMLLGSSRAGSVHKARHLLSSFL